MTPGDLRRIGLLAPMPSERAPLVKTLGLERAEVGGERAHAGRVGAVEAVVMMTGIGTELARQATARMLRVADVDHVMVVGVCGGVDPALGIGDVLLPAVVVDHVSGREFTPSHLGPTAPAGRLVTTDELLVGADVVATLRSDGVTALDMETSAVAEVCEDAGVPWSVVRSPSDRADDALIDEAVAGLANQDGSPNLGALVRYLARRPWRVTTLARLGRDLKAATTAASRAARQAIEHGGPA
jgi:adenosylhomocysteine nucleosidase